MSQTLLKALALASLLSAATLHADWSGALSLSNRYPWRGFLKDEGLVVQAALDHESAGGWYAGVLLSTLDFGEDRYGDAASRELGIYAGRSWELGADWRSELRLDHYDYDGELFGRSADYREVSARCHFRDLLSFELGYAGDGYDTGEPMLNYQLGARYPLGAALEFSAGVGYFDAGRVLGSDTRYGHLGLGWHYRHGVVDLRYVAASRSDTRERRGYYEDYGAYALDDAVVVSLTVGF